MPEILPDAIVARVKLTLGVTWFIVTDIPLLICVAKPVAEAVTL
jgi:hypothetical protein